MSAKFTLLKQYFEEGFWDIEKMKNAVVKGWITKEEFTLITHEDYTI